MTTQVPRDFHKKSTRNDHLLPHPHLSATPPSSLCNSNSSLQLLPHLFQNFPFTSAAISAPQLEFASETSAFANTRIDWKETPGAHVFKADLPGLKKEEVKVEIEEGRVLQISGERSKEKEEKDDPWHRPERSSGKFLRRFRLLENANMENGVLIKHNMKGPFVACCSES